MSKFICWMLMFLALPWLLSAQEFRPTTSQSQPSWSSMPEEAPLRRADIWSFSVAGGIRFFQNDVVEFQNKLFTPPATVVQKANDEGLACLQLGIKRGLDQELFPGISAGLKLDFSSVKISDLTLEIRRDNTIPFQYQGDFLTSHLLGLLPFVEIRCLTLLEALLTTSLPPWWYTNLSAVELYLYGGPRLNIHTYQEGDLKIDGLDMFNIAWEFGGGVELALSATWSLRLEYGMYSDVSDFEIKQSGVKIFSGDLDLSASRIALWLVYYF